MSIKKIALIAATIAGTASIASADSYFQLNERLQSSSILDLGTVRSEAAGVVEIYNYSGGQVGALLGTEAVNMGANSDVRVNAPLLNPVRRMLPDMGGIDLSPLIVIIGLQVLQMLVVPLLTGSV